MNIFKKVKSAPKEYFLLFSIILLATYLRFFRINELLGFWYDQGRDALVVRDFLVNGKLFLIGPEMGFTGIFRGPWYYWLIAPFYWLGGGEPLLPTYFLIATTIVALLIVYKIAEELGGKRAAIIATFVSSISYYLVIYSRWLSNPTPMYLISVLFLYSLFRYQEGKKWALPAVLFLTGLALNFGAAAEIFYIPVIFWVIYRFKKAKPNSKLLTFSFLLFAICFLPQVLFEFRHPGVFKSAIDKFLVADQSFTLTFWQVIAGRLGFYYNLIAGKFWIDANILFAPFLVAVTLGIFILRKEFFKNTKFLTLLILVISPIIGTFFFRGNQGNIYEYYFTGYYLFFIILVSVVLSRLSNNIWGKVITIIFLIFAIYYNYISLARDFSTPIDSANLIAYRNQLSAIDWIYENAQGEEFNVDVYVPPVIPYAYDYLFAWRGEMCGPNLCGKTSETVPLLYTLSEADPGAPYRLEAWQERQGTIGEIENSGVFGGITVERRHRIK